MRFRTVVRPAFAGLILAISICGIAAPARGADALSFDEDFWKRWGDGQAEIATYDLTFPRYDELREGTAVTIFVTETFSERDRVKADPGRHPDSDEFPVMKLNLVQDFPTGIYDYHLMTSAFVGLAESGRRPAGSLAKLTFSSQEWCGHVYHSIRPEAGKVHRAVHSYFDGEADFEETLPVPENAVYEDALFHWARGFAGPEGISLPGRSVTLLPSAERTRLRHMEAAWEEAYLSRETQVSRIEVPAGVFEVETAEVRLADGRVWRFFVEAEGDRRIVRWEASDGRRADLVASRRVKYWERHGNEAMADLAEIGLQPRGARMP